MLSIMSISSSTVQWALSVSKDLAGEKVLEASAQRILWKPLVVLLSLSPFNRVRRPSQTGWVWDISDPKALTPFQPWLLLPQQMKVVDRTAGTRKNKIPSR